MRVRIHLRCMTDDLYAALRSSIVGTAYIAVDWGVLFPVERSGIPARGDILSRIAA